MISRFADWREILQGAPALQRGYNCLTFEGPGQGGVIRKQKIPFRYDWEKVITPVVDYALNIPEEIDPKRIALIGRIQEIRILKTIFLYLSTFNLCP